MTDQKYTTQKATLNTVVLYNAKIPREIYNPAILLLSKSDLNTIEDQGQLELNLIGGQQIILKFDNDQD